ncbi:hypothetical protein IAU59_002936 [Kwoniella sp. CBS 9459]
MQESIIPSGSSGSIAGGHEEEEHMRRRRFHRRSRNGCQHCKKRRVRCDEARPVCGNCVRKKEEHLCQYTFSTTSGIADPSPSTSASTPLHSASASSTSPPTPPSTQHVTDAYYAAYDGEAAPSSSSSSGQRLVQNSDVVGPLGISSFDSLVPSFGTSNTNDLSNSGSGSGSGLPFLPMSLDDMFVQMPQWLLNHTSDVSSTNQASIQPYDELSSVDAQPNGLEALFDPADSLVAVHNDWGTGGTPDPAYTRQVKICAESDELSAYFPAAEQRQIFRHFIHETAPDLLVTATPPASNPWLVHFSPMALGKPYGTDISHDAFRCALLSLASFDMGMKMHSSLRSKDDNAMYALSKEQRISALTLLEMLKMIEPPIARSDAENLEIADYTLGVAIAISIRDRLAGTQEWEKPLAIGTDAILSLGGAASYLNKKPTRDRRFLLEQMACTDILGMMTIWFAPKIMTWDNDWLFHADAGRDGVQDHMHLVYGWDRPTLQFCARSMILGSESRKVEYLKRGNVGFNFEHVKTKVQEMERDILARGTELLKECQTLRTKAMAVQSARAVRGIMSVLQCMEISILATATGRALGEEHIQTKVKAVLDMVEEAISQGMYAGFLLPLLWMAICAVAENKQRANRLMILLQPHYHLEPGLLKRLVSFDWSQYANADFEEWDMIMKSTNTYVPVF